MGSAYPRRRGLPPLAFTLLLLLSACQAPRAERQPLPVLTAPVRPALFSDQVDTISTLEATQEVQLAAQVNGRIDQLPIRPGQRVKAGDLMLSLDDVQAQAEVARLQAEMDTNQLNYKRYNDLVRQGAATAFQRDEYRQRYISAREQLIASRANLAYRDVRAPISGTITDVLVKRGDVIQAGMAVTRLVRNDDLMARIDVPATYLNRLRTGLAVTLLDPVSQQPLAQGRVSEIDPVVNAASQSILVKAAFTGHHGQLRPGLRVRTRLLLGEKAMASVPFAAVTRQSGQSFVFTVGQGPRGSVAIQTPVVLGPLQHGRYPLLTDLKPGTSVIVSSQISLRQGLPVQPSSAPARPAPAGP